MVSLKKTARRMGSPLWKRIRPFIYTRIDWRIAEYVQRSGIMRGDNSWNQLVPSFLNAVSTVQTFGRELALTKNDHARELARLESEIGRLSATLEVHSELQSRVNELSSDLSNVWERVEFVRREIMFETKYAQAAAHRTSPAPSARIRDPEKITAAKRTSGLRLNLGCGHLPLDGYINVDIRELPSTDVVAEVGNLPFEEQTVTEISSAHLLEHFPQEELARRLLPYWRSLLVTDGRFRAVVPDGEAMLAGITGGTYTWEDFREVLFGAQDYDGDFHYNLFVPSSLTKLLDSAGFRDVHVVEKGRRNGKCFEFEIAATR